MSKPEPRILDIDGYLRVAKQYAKNHDLARAVMMFLDIDSNLSSGGELPSDWVYDYSDELAESYEWGMKVGYWKGITKGHGEHSIECLERGSDELNCDSAPNIHRPPTCAYCTDFGSYMNNDVVRCESHHHKFVLLVNSFKEACSE